MCRTYKILPDRNLGKRTRGTTSPEHPTTNIATRKRPRATDVVETSLSAAPDHWPALASRFRHALSNELRTQRVIIEGRGAMDQEDVSSNIVTAGMFLFSCLGVDGN